jgi:malonyl-CoA/methylmalonyl-CoA synthetase
VELVINECEAVIESAVIGIPDADFGEQVIGIVVCNKDDEINAEQQIIHHLSKNLAAFKKPKKLYFVRELPRNAMGKVQKNALKESYI